MQVGIVGFGAYVPCYRIAVEEIASESGHDIKKINASLAVREKAVPGKDEDTITIGVQAAKNALLRANINSEKIGAVYVGSESHPYVVKPSATIIATACNIRENYKAADVEFACKGGTAALQIGMSLVKAGMVEYALAVGADTAQAAPRDILEFTAGAGGGAFVIGSKTEELVAVVDDTCSLSSDTPDFWRRSLQKYPEHVGRFTAEPAYYSHIIRMAEYILERNSLEASYFSHVVFHQPNGKFPLAVAHKLGFVKKQYETGLLVQTIGNAYSGSSLLGLNAVLEVANPGEKILLVSYGSGSGCDAFIMTMQNAVIAKRNLAPSIHSYIQHKKNISYATYRRHSDLIY